MTKIEEGQSYKAKRFRSGTSGKGDWELISVEDERGKNPVTIFASNIPSNVKENEMFKVIKINSVSVGFKEDSKGLWQPQTSISAEVEAIPSEFDLGFDDGDDPWSDMDDGLPM